MEHYIGEIKEPYVDQAPFIDPIIFPVSYEVSFPEVQRQWIKNRDNNQCQMPVIDNDGLFIGYRGDTTPLQVHHIKPEYFYKSFEPDRYKDKLHHSPLNGITIGSNSHTHIHRDWVNTYKAEYERIPVQGRRGISLEAYINLQTAQGRPAWVTRYDKYFSLIATLNTYDHMIETDFFPFSQQYRGIVEQWYEKAIKTYPDFVKSYYDNRGW